MLWAFCLKSFAYDDTGAFYRNEAAPVVPGQTCGSLCLSSPNYYEGYLYQQERNRRFVDIGRDKDKVLKKRKATALNYREINNLDLIRGLGWGPDTEVSQFFSRESVRWSRVARDAGFQVAERGKSLHSSLWSEIRKPVLYNIRDRLRAPYRGKKLKLSEKIQVWLVEQTVDTGASTLDLDSSGVEQGLDSNTDFGISNTRVKFNPRLDPYKGRYGIRFKAKRFVRRSRPVQLAFNANYCNALAGFGDRLCAYEYELSTSFAFVNPTRKWSCSTYVSYQTEALDQDVYIVDGQIFDHKPWLAGVTFTYAFY
jgi:hypothetical protein